MTKLIECSWSKVIACQLSLSMTGRLKIALPYGWKSHKYVVDDIAEVLPIEEDKYRSAGGAVAGAIIGGVLTGGIGLLVGAAAGGRRRKEASYLIRFKDGNFVAFTEKSSSVIRVLDGICLRAKIANEVDLPSD